MRLTTEQREHMKEFVAALRSGNYTQGKGRLIQDNEGQVQHCCLGVACDVMRLNREDWINDSGEWVSGYLGEHETMPHEAQDYFGFPDGNPDIAHNDEGRSLKSAAQLNDEEGWTFDQIADAFATTFLY